MANKFPNTPHTNIEITVALDGDDKNISLGLEVFKLKFRWWMISVLPMPVSTANNSSMFFHATKHLHVILLIQDPHATKVNVTIISRFYQFHCGNCKVTADWLCNDRNDRTTESCIHCRITQFLSLTICSTEVSRRCYRGGGLLVMSIARS